MNASSSHLRAELQARTGIDFADYADDELVDAVTGWSGLVGLVGDLLIAAGTGLAVLVSLSLAAALGEWSPEERIALVATGATLGLGTAALLLVRRVRRRTPRETTRAFDLAGRMAGRVASDIESGRLKVGVGDAARGLVIVAALPTMTRVARRRFPLVGLLVAPVTTALVTRILTRAWPPGAAGTPPDSVAATARRIEFTLDSARDTVVSRLEAAVRWATLPLLAGGVTLILVGATIALISLMGP